MFNPKHLKSKTRNAIELWFLNKQGARSKIKNGRDRADDHDATNSEGIGRILVNWSPFLSAIEGMFRCCKVKRYE